jgi:hypothetical protein
MDVLAPVVDSIDSVAEPLRPFYEERDGKHILRTNVREHPDTLALRKALDEERGNVKSWKQKAAEYEAIGLSATEIADLKAQHERSKGKGNGDETIETLRKKFQDEWSPKVTAETERANKAERQLLERDINDDNRRAALEADMLPDEIDDQLRLTRHRFDRKDGKTIVLDEEGRPDTMTVERFWKEYYKAKKPRVYKGSGASGSGASGGAGGGNNGGAVTLSRADAKDPAKYRAAKSRAEKEGRPFVLTD